MPDARRLTPYGLLLAATLVASCVSDPGPPPLAVRDPGWGAFRQELARSLTPVGLLEKRRAERGIPLVFRVRDAELDEAASETVRTHRYCGRMVRVFVSALPPVEPGRVSSEEVLELDGSGRVARRWPVPPDLRVAGLEGNALLVPHTVRLPDRRRLATFLRVETDGRFGVERAAPPTPSEPFACPDTQALGDAPLPPQFNCWRYDTPQGPRILAYEGACLAVRS